MAAEPILTAHLFPQIEAKLVTLLRSLSAEDWQKPTVCPGWSVKDVAAHLLDTNIRNLSMRRDGFFGETPENAETYDGLVRFLDRLNADWVKAARRIGPNVLIEWLELTSRQVCEYFAKIDPFAAAVFPVSWAGETESLNWFDIAREYTERWHHQQQIRVAVAPPSSVAATEIMTRELYFPVLDTFMRALPRTYASVAAPDGTAIRISVTGPAGGSWFLLRRNSAWHLSPASDSSSSTSSVAAEVFIPDSLAWLLFTSGLPAAARSEIRTHGETLLTAPIFRTVAVMASRKEHAVGGKATD